MDIIHVSAVPIKSGIEFWVLSDDALTELLKHLGSHGIHWTAGQPAEEYRPFRRHKDEPLYITLLPNYGGELEACFGAHGQLDRKKYRVVL